MYGTSTKVRPDLTVNSIGLKQRNLSRGVNRAALSISAVLISLAALCLTSFYMGPPRWEKAVFASITRRPLASALLDLHANTAGEYFRVSWNPNAAAVQRATQAVLVINDGGQDRRVSIAPADLRIGRLIYRPGSTEVRFRLEVTSATRDVATESVIALGFEPPSRGAPPPHTGASDRASLAANTALFADTRELSGSKPRNFSRETTRLLPARDRLAPIDFNIRKTAPPANLSFPPHPPLTVNANAMAVVAAPPELNAGAYSTIESRLPGQAERAILIPAPPPVSVIETAAIANAPIARGAIPVVTINEPKALRQVRPQIPADMRNLVVSRNTIEVRVYINEKGQVINAAVIGRSGPLSGNLVPLSLEAARRWTFEPARRGEQSIASEHNISFVFEPGQR